MDVEIPITDAELVNNTDIDGEWFIKRPMNDLESAAKVRWLDSLEASIREA